MIALTRAILMKIDTVVSLHAHRLFEVAHAHAKKTPVTGGYIDYLFVQAE